MRTKSSQFYRGTSLREYDLLAITETWFNNNISSSEFFDRNYNVYRKDRSSTATGQGRGGGVMFAVRADLCSSLITLDLANDFLDQICVRIQFSCNKSLTLILSYIPPCSNIEIYQKHLENLVHIINISKDLMKLFFLVILT